MKKNEIKTIKIEMQNGKMNFAIDGFNIYEAIGLLSKYRDLMIIESLNGIEGIKKK